MVDAFQVSTNEGTFQFKWEFRAIFTSHCKIIFNSISFLVSLTGHRSGTWKANVSIELDINSKGNTSATNYFQFPLFSANALQSRRSFFNHAESVATDEVWCQEPERGDTFQITCIVLGKKVRDKKQTLPLITEKWTEARMLSCWNIHPPSNGWSWISSSFHGDVTCDTA